MSRRALFAILPSEPWRSGCQEVGPSLALVRLIAPDAKLVLVEWSIRTWRPKRPDHQETETDHGMGRQGAACPVKT